jgi:hypothetical protein
MDHEAAWTVGFSEVAVAPRRGGLSSAAAAPIPAVIAPITGAGTHPSLKEPR